MSAEAHFRAVAPEYMAKFMEDFDASLDDAAAVFGNFGHESLGLTALQEISPTVKGSAGGWGWAQWTGPRRRAFLAYCTRNGKDPASDSANYAYVFVELSGASKRWDYRYAVTRLKAAKSLLAKVKAFELAYEGAGVKHYDSRLRWAEIARAAYLATKETEA
jgi:hypothetical protein